MFTTVQSPEYNWQTSQVFAGLCLSLWIFIHRKYTTVVLVNGFQQLIQQIGELLE